MRLHVPVPLLRDTAACRQAHSQTSVERYLRDCFAPTSSGLVMTELWIPAFAGMTKSGSNKAANAPYPTWRRGRDSNPRALAGYAISNRAHSATYATSPVNFQRVVGGGAGPPNGVPPMHAGAGLLPPRREGPSPSPTLSVPTYD